MTTATAADRLADQNDRTARIARRVGGMTLGATATIDQVRVRRLSLTGYELDGTVVDLADVAAEIAYLAEERLGLDEAPATMAGQLAAAEHVARVAEGRMLRGPGVDGRYAVRIEGGHVVARWTGSQGGKALAMFAASLPMRKLAGEVVGCLVRVVAP